MAEFQNRVLKIPSNTGTRLFFPHFVYFLFVYRRSDAGQSLALGQIHGSFSLRTPSVQQLQMCIRSLRHFQPTHTPTHTHTKLKYTGNTHTIAMATALNTGSVLQLVLWYFTLPCVRARAHAHTRTCKHTLCISIIAKSESLTNKTRVNPLNYSRAILEPKIAHDAFRNAKKLGKLPDATMSSPQCHAILLF